VPAHQWMTIDSSWAIVGVESTLILIYLTLHNVTYRRNTYAGRVTTSSQISVKTPAQSP
jgi:hypothetical protein